MNTAIERFQTHLSVVFRDKDQINKFISSVETPDDLIAYAKEAGYPLDRAAADHLFEKGQAAYDAYSGRLEDGELDGVNGGVSFGAIGAGVGAAMGLVALGILTAGAAPAIALTLAAGAMKATTVAAGIVLTGGAYVTSGVVTMGTAGLVADRIASAIKS